MSVDMRPAHRVQYFKPRVQFRGESKIDPVTGETMVSLNGSKWWPLNENGHNKTQENPLELTELKIDGKIGTNGNGRHGKIYESKQIILESAAD